MTKIPFLCKGKRLTSRIAQCIICEIFAGEDHPTHIDVIACKTYEYHQKHGGVLPSEKVKREIVIMHALNELRLCELTEKFESNRWIILKKRRMMDQDTIVKLRKECMNPLSACLGELSQLNEALKKNIPLIETEIDIYEVRAQVIGFLNRKDIEKISTYRSSMQFDITRTLQIIDSLNELGNELEILFSILGKYSTYLPISDNS